MTAGVGMLLKNTHQQTPASALIIATSQGEIMRSDVSLSDAQTEFAQAMAALCALLMHMDDTQDAPLQLNIKGPLGHARAIAFDERTIVMGLGQYATSGRSFETRARQLWQTLSGQRS